MEKVSATLAAHGKPVSKAWLEHKDRKLGKAEHVRRALELLVSEGFVREVPNAIKGQYVGFEHAKAYVEDNDEEAGERPQAGPF